MGSEMCIRDRSGIRPGDAAALRDAWAARGLRPDGAWERDGWACLRLVAG